MIFVPQWVIEKKRDGKMLSDEEIRSFIQGYTDDHIPDYQMSALAMAIYLQGMNFEEITVLTDAMMKSGDMVDTSRIDRPKVDKHSTGGIGDKVSMILAPLVAACGAAVPMISGRGLGITGGTLDKLEAIPGYRTNLLEEEFLRVVEQCGCSIIGQTERIAPADKKLYALRDVTATVPSIPLIVASIMSKKLAEGIDALVLDVKCGKGAFMKNYKDAQDLAFNLVEVGSRMGKSVAAVITDMNQPLGCTAGNALEIAESIECLRGEGAEDLMEVTMALGARMLTLTGLAEDPVSAFQKLQHVLDSGQALEVFAKMVELHGGDPGVIENPRRMVAANFEEEILAEEEGVITDVDADIIGRACLLLGAGRQKVSDTIDPSVGISHLCKVGNPVQKGDVLCHVHARSRPDCIQAKEDLRSAFRIGSDAEHPPILIHETVLPEKSR